MDQDLFNLLQTADPETLQLMMEAGVAPERIALLGQQAQRANQMGMTPQPEATRVGNTTVAASPIEHIAAALRSGIGISRMRGAEQQQMGEVGQQGAGRLAYLKMLAGQGQAPADPNAPPMP